MLVTKTKEKADVERKGLDYSEWFSKVDKGIESSTFEECEEIIAKNIVRFYAVGRALAKIRDEGWYKKLYPSFADYCEKKWRFKKRYAYYLIGSSEVMDNLKEQGVHYSARNEHDEDFDEEMDISELVGKRMTLPSTETQARELMGLKPDEQIKVWDKAKKTAPNGKPTASHIKKIKEEYLSEKMKMEEEIEEGQTTRNTKSSVPKRKPKPSRLEEEQQRMRDYAAQRYNQSHGPLIDEVKRVEDEQTPWEDEPEPEKEELEEMPSAKDQKNTPLYLPICKLDDRQINSIVENSNIYELNEMISTKIRDFRIIANALLRIKQENLYLKYAPTFEAYCEKWGINLNTV
jgi:hypothetical protein